MPPEKNTCLVLTVMPYRESSAIAALFSRERGRISGIAKGVRRDRGTPLVLERGLLVELSLYVKHHRDLHSIGEMSVVNYFPSIRSDLGKLALRDAAFELVLKSVTVPEHHPELFDFAVSYVSRIESLPQRPLPLHELMAFVHGWAYHLGIHCSLGGCLRCGSPRVATQGGDLVIENGGCVCSACSGGRAGSPYFLPGEIVGFLLSRSGPAEGPVPALQTALPEQVRITRLLIDYCRYHLDLRGDFPAMGFLETMVMGPPLILA